MNNAVGLEREEHLAGRDGPDGVREAVVGFFTRGEWAEQPVYFHRGEYRSPDGHFIPPSSLVLIGQEQGIRWTDSSEPARVLAAASVPLASSGRQETYCHNCGWKLTDRDIRFCTSCGERVVFAPTAAQDNAQEPEGRGEGRSSGSGGARRTVGWGMFSNLVRDSGGTVYPGTTGFCWGGFLWPGIWPFLNGQPLLGIVFWVAVMVSEMLADLGLLVAFGFATYLGLYGHALAQMAQPGKWHSAKDVLKSNRPWVVVFVGVSAIVATSWYVLNSFLTMLEKALM